MVLLGPPPDTLAVLLDDPDAHDFPSVARILHGLTPEQATKAPERLPYSVARIVAHMNSNMNFNLGLIHGALMRIAREAKDLDRVVYPAKGSESSWTVGYKLACSVAKHNAYHLGQIVVLRRLIGAWEGGSWSQTL